MDEELKRCPESHHEAESREALLESLAGCLKKAREDKQLSLEEAAMTLKLRTVYLEALESGDWSEMPGEVYALGFLKQYAAHLGVDVSGSIEKLKTGDYKLTKPLTFPDPPIAPTRTWVIVAALAFIVLFILFNIFDSGEPEKSVEPKAQYNEMQLVPEIETPAEVKPQAEIPSAPATETKTGLETDKAEVTNPDNEPTTQKPQVATHEYRLTASGGAVWLQVYTDPGQDEYAELVREALLKDGESTVIHSPLSSLLLTCGNAAAIQIDIDGHTTAVAGSLGEEGKVLRDFRLTAE